MANENLDDILNNKVESYRKAVDDVYSGKTSFKGYVPSGPQTHVPATYAIKDLFVGNQPNTPPGKNPPNKAYDFEAEKFAFKEYMGAQMNQARSKDQYSKMYSYNTGPDGAFYDRYKEWHSSNEAFDKTGFHPLRDNEYNFNASGSGSFMNQAGRVMNQGWLGVTTGAASMAMLFRGDVFGQNPGEARQYARNSAMGNSSRSGVGGFMNNLVLNFGYTAGIMVGALGENLVGSAMGAFSKSTTAGRTIQNFSKTGKGVFKATDSAIDGAKVLTQGLDDFNDINKVRLLHETTKASKFQNIIQSGVGRVLNPLSNVTDMYYNTYKAVDSFTGLAKNSATFSQTAGALYRDFRNINMALSEARLEGGMVENTVADKLYANYFEKNGKPPSLDEQYKFQEQGKHAGFETAVFNAGLIYITNKMVFDNILNPRLSSTGVFGQSLKDFAVIGGEKGFGTYGKIVFNNTAKEFQLIRNNFKGYLKGIKTDPFAKTVTKTVGYVKSNFAEGFQESAQEVISKANENYYLETYDSNAVKSQLYSRALFGIESTPLSYYGKEVGNQFTAQGLETFGSGFFMGVLGGGLNMSAKFLYNGSNKIFRPSEYAEYKKNKEALTTGMVNHLNSFGPEQFMNSDLMTLGAEETASIIMGQGNKKEIMDVESENLINHMTSLLEKKAFTPFMESFESYLEMTDAEFLDAFKTVPKEEAAKYKDRLRSVIDKSKQIQKRYDYFSAKYPNPVNLEQYNKSDFDYEDAFMMHKAWNMGVRNAVFYTETYDDVQKRMINIVQKHYEQRPLENLSKRDSDIIMNVDQMGQEINFLQTEITSLSKMTDSESKQLVKEKGIKLAALKEYKKAHAAFDYYFHRARYAPNAKALLEKTKGKDAKITDKEVDDVLDEYFGEVTEKNEIALLKDLKEKYNTLIKTIGDTTNGAVFNNKLDQSFNLVLDFYKLGDESKKLVSSINLLNDPQGYVDIYNKNYEWMQKLYLQKRKYYENVVKQQLSKIEDNALLNSLADEGIYISATDFALFKTKGIPPTEFFDDINGLVIPEGTQAYNRYYKKLQQLQDLKDDSVGETSTEELQDRINELKQKKKEQIRKRTEEFKRELKIETGKTIEELEEEDLQNKNAGTAKAITTEITVLKDQAAIMQLSTDEDELALVFNNLIERKIFTVEDYKLALDSLTPAQKTKINELSTELKKSLQDPEIAKDLAEIKVIVNILINAKLDALSIELKNAPDENVRSVEKTTAWKEYQKALVEIEDRYNELVAKARSLIKQINAPGASSTNPQLIKENYQKQLEELDAKMKKDIDALPKDSIRVDGDKILPKGKSKTLTIDEIYEELKPEEYVELIYKSNSPVTPIVYFKDKNDELRENNLEGALVDMNKVTLEFTGATKFTFKQEPNKEKVKEIEARYKKLKNDVLDAYNKDKASIDTTTPSQKITQKSDLNVAGLLDFRIMLYDEYLADYYETLTPKEIEELDNNPDLDNQKFIEWYSLPKNKKYFDTYNKEHEEDINKKDFVFDLNNVNISTKDQDIPTLINYRDKLNNEIATLEEENLTTKDPKTKSENEDDIRILNTSLKSLNSVIEQRQFANFSPKIQESITKIQKLLELQKGVEPGVLLTEDDAVTKLKKGQKAYRINKEIHRRTTNVIQEVLPDNYNYTGKKKIEEIFNSTIGAKGLNSSSIASFISELSDTINVSPDSVPGINDILLKEIESELKSLEGKSVEQINLEKEQQKISDHIADINKKIIKFEKSGEENKVQNLINERTALYPILASLGTEASIKKEKSTITDSDLKELKRVAIFFLENPKEPTTSGSVVTRYPALFKAITDIERKREEELGRVLKRTDIEFLESKAKDKAFGIKAEKEINDRYDAKLAALGSTTTTVSTESINVNTTFDIIMDMISEKSFEDGRIAGNFADEAKDYLESGKKVAFDKTKITPEAYKSLFEFLDQIKKEVDEGRMYLIGRDLVVYDSNITKSNGQDRVAGEIDLLVATEKGIEIIDIKTGTASKWRDFNKIKKDTDDISYSKREEYTMQQGAYATMLEKMIDAPVVGIMLLPIERTSDPVTNKVTSIKSPTAKSVFENLTYKKDAEGNYIRNKVDKLEFTKTNVASSKWFIPLYRTPIQDKLDILFPQGAIKFIPGLDNIVKKQMDDYISQLNARTAENTTVNVNALNAIEKNINNFIEINKVNNIEISNEVKALLASKKSDLAKTIVSQEIKKLVDLNTVFALKNSTALETLTKKLGDIKYKFSFDGIDLSENSDFIQEQLEDAIFSERFDIHKNLFAGKTTAPTIGQLIATEVLNLSGILTDAEYAPVKTLNLNRDEVSLLIHESVKRIQYLKVMSKTDAEASKLEKYQNDIKDLQMKAVASSETNKYLDLLLSVQDTLDNGQPEATIIILENEIAALEKVLTYSNNTTFKIDFLNKRLETLNNLKTSIVKIYPILDEDISEEEEEGTLEEFDLGNVNENILAIGDVLYNKNDNFTYTVNALNKNGTISLVNEEGIKKTVRKETIAKDYLTKEQIMEGNVEDEAYVPTASEIKITKESQENIESFIKDPTTKSKMYTDALTKTPAQIRKELIENAKNCI